jgi:hypothetical protein
MHAIPMGNYVIGVRNYVIVSPSELGNYTIADNQVEGLAVRHCPGEAQTAGAEQRSSDRAKDAQHALVGQELAGQSLGKCAEGPARGRGCERNLPGEAGLVSGDRETVWLGPGKADRGLARVVGNLARIAGAASVAVRSKSGQGRPYAVLRFRLIRMSIRS